MKVTVNNTTPTQKKPFPKLMVNKYGCVRLVFSETDSLILKSASGDCDLKLMIAGGWDFSDFTDFEGSITLSND